MMKMKNWMLVTGMSAVLCSAGNQGMAQQDNGGGGRPGRGNFDPAQFRQIMMDRIKEELEVANDDEWKALQPLVQKVTDARMQAMSGMGRGMMRPRRNADDQGGGGMRRGPFGEPSPEQDALQKAIDAKASKAELKAAMTKFVEARKVREEQLKAAQEELRKVLTTRQEAIATANGLL
jgi:hypothetical protein